jgi:hypothetical protein
MVGADTKYQSKYRNTSAYSDPHRSFLQIYCIENKDTYSDSYKSLYADVFTALKNSQIGRNGELWEDLSKLTNAWRKNHPGKSFWSSNAS